MTFKADWKAELSSNMNAIWGLFSHSIPVFGMKYNPASKPLALGFYNSHETHCPLGKKNPAITNATKKSPVIRPKTFEYF